MRALDVHIVHPVTFVTLESVVITYVMPCVGVRWATISDQDDCEETSNNSLPFAGGSLVCQNSVAKPYTTNLPFISFR
jgi:hypothetical protein